MKGERGKGGEKQKRRAEKLKQIEEEWLDIFGDPYCNRHLMYGIVEVVLVRVFPELAERVTSELLGERLG